MVKKCIHKLYRGSSKYGRFGEGYYFTEDIFQAKEYALAEQATDTYGFKVYEAEIDICKPLDFYKESKLLEKITGKANLNIYPGKLTIGDRKKMVKYAKKHGYDGIIHKDTDAFNQNYMKSYVVFEKNQISSIERLKDIR